MIEEKIRLNKYIADCGVCSRREADKLIEEGKVTVNGKAPQMGQKVSSEDEIIVKGKKISSPNEKVVLAYYKPVGITCTEKDRFADKTLKDAFEYPIRVTYAGRLDKESEGLLLMTNDGELINRLMKSSSGHEKEYLVKVTKPLADDFKEKMEAGIVILGQKTLPCKVTVTGAHTFNIVLKQGLNRQIRRMCEALGYRVTKLRRIRFINITLGDMKPGDRRNLTKEEIRGLKSADKAD